MTVMTIVKIILFAISTIGLWEIVRRAFPRVHISFVPGITIAIQSTLLFFAGLFNLLVEISGFMYAAGFAGLVFFLWKDRGIRFLKHYLTPSVLFMAATLLVMGIFLHGKVFTHYDSFSHWALVVKRMIATNRFPNHADTMIRFQEYPVGSAAFIYYVAKLSSREESMQMLAQLYMILAGVIPLFSLCKKGWLPVTVLIAAFTNYLFVYNNAVTDLLVDTLLPVAAMGGLLYTLQYCRKGAGEADLIPAAFYLVQLTQIKNSGLFFTAFIAVILLIHCTKDKKGLFRAGCVLLPLITFYLWHKHCSYAFDMAVTTKHAMTATNYIRTFGAKSSGDMQGILQSMAEFVVSWKDTWMTLGILAAVLVLVLALRKDREKRRDSIRILGMAVLLFAVWQIGTYGMYLFSMPKAEASELAGIGRYERTIVISMLYLALIPVIGIVSECFSGKRTLAFACTAGMLLLVLAHMWTGTGKISFAPAEAGGGSTKRRDWVENVREEYQIPDGSSYAIVMPRDNKDNYMLFLCKYIFLSDEVDSVSVKSARNMDSIDAEYILVYDQKNETAKEWIQEHYPDQAGKPVVVTNKGK